MYIRIYKESGQPQDFFQSGNDHAFWIEPSLLAGIGQPRSPAPISKPIFTIECPAGCPPVAAGRCRNVLHKAIQSAIQLSSNAASKLEASNPDTETVRLFRFFFGHHPSKPVSWAGNKASGAIVAHRFRKVAEELGGGRRMVFRCDAGCSATTNASTDAATDPNLVKLCQRFWTTPVASRPRLSPQFFRAGIILHEMLHLLYHDFFHHSGHPSGDPERRRDNSHCYEAFALRVAGFGADPADVSQCRARST
jgi:hypothetical protein